MYYLYSENKGADQLPCYCEADLQLWFCICKMLVFMRWLIVHVFYQTNKMLYSSISLFAAPFQQVEDVFNVLHHKMDIPHSLMVVWPKILETRTLDLEQRHRFLLKVNRAQYDPKKENYVSLKQLVATKDEEFCIEIAQASLLEYYNFLKTI